MSGMLSYPTSQNAPHDPKPHYAIIIITVLFITVLFITVLFITVLFRRPVRESVAFVMSFTMLKDSHNASNCSKRCKYPQYNAVSLNCRSFCEMLEIITGSIAIPENERAINPDHKNQHRKQIVCHKNNSI